MTRKEALKQIAQRCMDGGDVDAAELCNVFGKRVHMGAMDSLVFHITFAYARDSVADLEAELLPDGYEVQVFVDEVAVCKIYKKEVIDLVLNRTLVAMADADNEPLARLAALCLALAEMEECK